MNENLCLRPSIFVPYSYPASCSYGGQNLPLPVLNDVSTDLPFAKCIDLVFSFDFKHFWRKDFENPCVTAIGQIFDSFIDYLSGNVIVKDDSADQEYPICRLLPPFSRIGRCGDTIAQTLGSAEEIPPYFQKIVTEFYDSFNFQNALFLINEEEMVQCIPHEFLSVADRRFRPYTTVSHDIDVKINHRLISLRIEFHFYNKKENSDTLDINRGKATIHFSAHEHEISSATSVNMLPEEMEIITSSAIKYFKTYGMEVYLNGGSTGYQDVPL